MCRANGHRHSRGRTNASAALTWADRDLNGEARDLIRARLSNTFDPRIPEDTRDHRVRSRIEREDRGKESLITSRFFEASQLIPRRRLQAEKIHRSRVQVPSALQSPDHAGFLSSCSVEWRPIPACCRIWARRNSPALGCVRGRWTDLDEWTWPISPAPVSENCEEAI